MKQHMRRNIVGNHYHNDQDRQNIYGPVGELPNFPEENRVQPFNNHDSAKPKENQVSDPDSSMKIHGLLAVIPPPCMEQLFHVPAYKIFQCPAYDKGCQKNIRIPAVPAHESI